MVDHHDDESRRRLFHVWFLLLALPLFGVSFLNTYSRLYLVKGLRVSAVPHSSRKPKILYIITSVREYDENGKYDRFRKNTVPIASQGIRTMIDAGFDVDLYLITKYNVTEKRRQLLQDALPSTSVGLQVWDDAIPLYYPDRIDERYHRDPKILDANPMVLARQHRYVIKDKLAYYDVFVNFEDDMYITGAHVQHYMDISEELFRLRQAAPEAIAGRTTPADYKKSYFGAMTQAQLARMIPGFIRVEVTPSKFKPPEDIFAHLPRDFEWNATLPDVRISSVCCDLNTETIPTPSSSDSLYMWETSIDALSIRKMPESSSLSWVLLQGGNLDFMSGDYWTGRNGQFGDNATRPKRSMADLSNNQGGWMATQRQLVEWQDSCAGNFLPPFETPIKLEGFRDNVEFWSGPLNLFGPKGCQFQRFLTLDPDGFSRHLLYHTTNHKQKRAKFNPKYKNDPVRKHLGTGNMHQFWGELNAIRKNAEREMKQELAAAAAE